VWFGFKVPIATTKIQEGNIQSGFVTVIVIRHIKAPINFVTSLTRW
jgi:hypothetical protein